MRRTTMRTCGCLNRRGRLDPNTGTHEDGMAKLLETLRQRDGGTVPVLPLPSRPPAVEHVLPIHAEAPPQPAMPQHAAPKQATPEQADEEYLFVEVGGPGKKMDASPSV